MGKNLTTGSVWKTIFYFSLPYFFSYFLQTLYGMADLFIIGQFNGVDSTTAVSIGSQVMHMLTVMIVGLAMGSTVMLGRAVGGNDRKQVNLAVGNTVTLFVTLSLVLMAGLLLAAGGIVSVMSTPEEAVSGTRQYLMICFAGISFIHNVASILLAYWASTHFADTLYPMGWAAPAGSMISVMICVVAFVWMKKHPEKLTSG